MAGFAGSSGGGGSSATATLGEMAPFHQSVGVPTGWLDTTSAQTLLQATYPELYIEVGLLQDTSVEGTYTENASPGAGSTLNAVAGNASNWVVVANSGDMFTCGADPSGTWTENTTAGANTLRVVLTDGTKWAAAGDGTDLQTATDPTGTWTEQSALFGVSMYAGHYAAGYGVIAGTNGEIWTATDLTGTWTENTAGIPNSVDDIRSLHYANSIWVAGCLSGEIWTATDPTGTWTANAAAVSTHNIYALGYDGTVWIAGSQLTSECYTAADPTGTWTQNAAPTNQFIGLYCDEASGTCIAVDDAGTDAMETSAPAGAWAENASLTAETNNFQDISGFGRYVVAVGNDGTMWTRDLISYNPSTQFYLPASTTTDKIMKVS